MNKIHTLKCGLAAEVLRTHGRLRLQVTGWSMFPAVRPGDTLIIDRIASSETSEGDVVLFERDRRLFAHRLIAKYSFGEQRLLTCGDAMPSPDLPVTESELLGRVSFIVRNGKYIQPRKILRFHERVVGTLVHRSKIAARVIVGIHGLYQSQVQTA